MDSLLYSTNASFNPRLILQMPRNRRTLFNYILYTTAKQYITAKRFIY